MLTKVALEGATLVSSHHLVHARRALQGLHRRRPVVQIGYLLFTQGPGLRVVKGYILFPEQAGRLPPEP